MPGFKDLSLVFEQRTTDPVVPASDRVTVYQLNDGSTNVLFPNGDKKRLDNTLVEAAIAEISGNLGTIYHGVVDCIVNQLTYTITHPAITVLTDVPVASLIVPMSGSTLAVHGIFNRTTTSFDVVLSDEPDSTSYKISWMLVSSSGFVFTNDSQYVHKTGNESISGYKTFENDLTINGKLTVTGLIDPTGLELVPQAANPGIVTDNTLWLNSTDANKLYVGSAVVGSGGGNDDPNAVKLTGNQSIYDTKTFEDSTVFSGLVSVLDIINYVHGIDLTPQFSNPGLFESNTLWINSGDSNKLYFGDNPVSNDSNSYNVGGITVDSSDMGTPTEVNIDALLLTSYDISLQGYGVINVPANMQNGQSINILLTQDLTPFDWPVEYAPEFEFPSGVAHVPSTGEGSTTMLTLLKIRNRYFVSGISNFL